VIVGKIVVVFSSL